MKAMHEALKRMIQEMHDKKGHGESGLGIDDADESSDLAPDLHEGDPKEMMGEDKDIMPNPHADPEEMSSHGLHPEHMKILQGLADGGARGKGNVSLHGRVADKAKERIASIIKSKKG